MTTKIDMLKEVILKGNKNQTLMVLDSIEGDINTDNDLVQAITDPSTISEIHGMLAENLGVNPRAMMLKNRVQSRKRRALFFVHAMKNGVNKADDVKVNETDSE